VASRAALIGLLALAGCASRQDTALLDRFAGTLAAQDSATAALGQWCAARHIAEPAVIRALPVVGETTVAPAVVRSLLDPKPGGSIGYRHVRLACGNTVLSEAHNWFVPSRLTPEMNARLANTDAPFGAVASPLRFTRERLGSVRGAAPGCGAGTILSHRALLRLPDGRPLAYLIECYQPANLAR